MKYSFVLALFWAFVTVSEFPAFAQTYDVRCGLDTQAGVLEARTHGGEYISAGQQDSVTRIKLISAQAETSLQSANAVNSLAVTNPEQSANLWKWSVSTLISANALDVASSYGLKEGNPLLGTRFNGRSLAIKSGLTAGQLVAQYFVLRKHPERRRTAAIVNFAIAGGLGIVSAHNFGIRSGR